MGNNHIATAVTKEAYVLGLTTHGWAALVLGMLVAVVIAYAMTRD